MSKCEKCLYYKTKQECNLCNRLSSVVDNYPAFTPNTNYDRIRNMSVDELAENIFNIFERTRCMLPVECDGRVGKVGCQECIKEWLKSEVTDNDKV